MRAFRVGGAIRDELMGRVAKDHDWVVVGSTTEEMLAEGFQQVGADFPVFLHPVTKEEFALARQERKTGPGYHGFETHFEPDVTLEQDLFRRDLTINAMAEDDDGVIIDPFGGQEDLKNGVLRHVSEAFAEDPVRVLRVARFAARYDLEVHADTKQLMKDMVAAGELDHLTPERVWVEFAKAMMEEFPYRFFWELEACGAMNVLFPELKRVIIFNGHALNRAVLMNLDLVDRCMVLFTTVSKENQVNMFDRLKVPSEVRDMCLKYKTFVDGIPLMRFDAGEMLDLMKTLDLFRQPEHAFKMVHMCALTSTYMEIFDFLKAFRAARKVTFAMLDERRQAMLRGSDIGKAIDGLRLKAIEHAVR